MNQILTILAACGIILIIGVLGELYFADRDNNQKGNE